LNNPDLLRQCIPGCEELTRLSDSEFEGKVVAKIGPVKASFTGKVTLSDLDPPNGYTISGEGKGGVAGFAKGGAKVKLSDAGAGTLLEYAVDASVGGKLAQIGGRLIEGTVNQMAGDFFGKFSELVSAGQAPPAANAATPIESATPVKSAKASRTWLWIVAAAVVAVIAISVLTK
jgi:carbon monoxide dehydrogenase subunit G